MDLGPGVQSGIANSYRSVANPPIPYSISHSKTVLANSGERITAAAEQSDGAERNGAAQTAEQRGAERNGAARSTEQQRNGTAQRGDGAKKIGERRRGSNRSE